MKDLFLPHHSFGMTSMISLSLCKKLSYTFPQVTFGMEKHVAPLEFARPPSYLVFDANFLKIDPLSICSLTVLNSLNSNSPLSLRHMC